MTNSSNIYCRLSGDNFWVKRRDLSDIEVIERLRGQMILLQHVFLLNCDDFFLRKFFEDEGLLLRSCLGFYHFDYSLVNERFIQ